MPPDSHDSRESHRPRPHRLPVALALLAVAVLTVAGGCATLEEARTDSEPADVAVEHLLLSIGEALDIAHARHHDGLGLELTEVSIELQTVVDVSATEGLSIPLLGTLGSSEEITQTHVLNLSLAPPGGLNAAAADVADTSHPHLARGLVEALEGAFLVARGAREGLERLHPDGVPLEARTLSVSVGFALRTGEGASPTISILGIGIGASRSEKHFHQVRLSFALPDPEG